VTEVRFRCAPRPSKTFPEPDSGHAGTISLTIRGHRASWNAMNPRIQSVRAGVRAGASGQASGQGHPGRGIREGVGSAFG
jgi:hypothetical protein